MGVEVRRIETAYAETPVGTPDRVEASYELGFATPSGGWVKMASVPEAVVQAAEDNAKAAQQPDTGPADLSQPGTEPSTDTPAEPTTPAPADPAAPAPAAPDPAAEPTPVDPAAAPPGEAG